MKKIWLLGSALALAIGLSACSDKTEDKASEKKTEEASSEKVDVSGTLLDFYLNLKATVNAKDGDLNAYEGSETKPAADVRQKASESAAAVAAELKIIKAPAELKDQKEDLEGALKDFTASYEAKAEELKKDAPSLDAANETFTQGEDKLKKAFESAKLVAPTFGAELQ
ncbi:hypothetical protein [Peribacillus deserti]|uniref:Lipoprotein n=1 Tax=Peribacillus deserti TaxID=673318 RepID=A0A2N5M0Q1_9BACI|nr:hypothetical protein [Peribacillus deserti]PLT27932.1 hypothetical protein CUU66_21295 [Peribacillus deserti]